MKATILSLLIVSGLHDSLASKKVTEDPKKPKKVFNLEAEYRRACIALEHANKLLKEERKRWEEIHKQKIETQPKEAELTTTKEDITVKVTIEPKVENEINSQPITREYHFGRKPSNSLLDYLDIGVMFSYSISASNEDLVGVRGLLPGLFLGVRPLDHWAKIPDQARGWGLGVYCNILTAGGTIYYSHPKMQNASIHLLVGWDYKGNITPGLALGVRF